MNSKFIYFDHAATSPLSKNVLEEINLTYKNYWGNASSTHEFGINCSLYLEKLRQNIAIKFNADSEDIIFTSGSSESILLVFNNLADNFLPKSITISEVEHQATIIASNKLLKRGWLINKWQVDKNGIVNMERINEYINNQTKLVSIIWGHSEIGTLQPVQLIGEACLNKNIFFHIDATQIVANGIFNWKDLNCDLLSISAHKFGGPKGIGILFTNNKSRNFLRNRDISLTQENNIRQGTQALPNISGLDQAIKNIKGKIYFSEFGLEFKENKTIYLRNYFLNKIKKHKNFHITGSIKHRLPNHISFILFNSEFVPIEAYKIINFMSENNIFISSGSACSSSTDKPSKTLLKLGFDKNKLYSNIRLSFNDENTIKELEIFYDLITRCINIF